MTKRCSKSGRLRLSRRGGYWRNRGDEDTGSLPALSWWTASWHFIQRLLKAVAQYFVGTSPKRAEFRRRLRSMNESPMVFQFPLKTQKISVGTGVCWNVTCLGPRCEFHSQGCFASLSRI